MVPALLPEAVVKVELELLVIMALVIIVVGVRLLDVVCAAVDKDCVWPGVESEVVAREVVVIVANVL